MRSFLIAAAALAAIAVPTEPSEARRGGHHWQSGHQMGHNMRGHRQWNRHFVRHHRPMHGHFRDHRRFRGHRFVHHGGFRGHPFAHHRRFRSHRSVVFISGGFGWGSGFGWGHGCRTMWFDGWAWRCAW
jgi:hypothetical protein